MNIEVNVLTFCENCGKHRDVALLPVGRWFIWFCFPCQLRRTMKMAWRRIKEELHFQRVEAREAKVDR